MSTSIVEIRKNIPISTKLHRHYQLCGLARTVKWKSLGLIFSTSDQHILTNNMQIALSKATWPAWLIDNSPLCPLEKFSWPEGKKARADIHFCFLFVSFKGQKSRCDVPHPSRGEQERLCWAAELYNRRPGSPLRWPLLQSVWFCIERLRNLLDVYMVVC